MTASPQTRIPESARRDLEKRLERLLSTEARILVDQGVYPPGARGFALARLEVALLVGAYDPVEAAVAAARREGATWDEIAAATGLASRGSAARRFANVRGRGEAASTPNVARLNRAKARAQDDFRTRVEDVEAELQHYEKFLRGASVLLPCDDAESAFWRYLSTHFDRLGLRSVIATAYRPGGGAFVLEKTAEGTIYRVLEGDGSFESVEVQALVDGADIVVTNPPFSRFQDLVRLLAEHSTDFLLLGGTNAVTTGETWRLFRSGGIRFGVSSNGGAMPFSVPEAYHSPTVRLGESGQREALVSVRWYTTLDHGHQPKLLDLSAVYDPARHPRYDNLDAIEVGALVDLPRGYNGVMGVPVTYLARHDPSRFDILGLARELAQSGVLTVGGHRVFERVLIRAVSPNETI